MRTFYHAQSQDGTINDWLLRSIGSCRMCDINRVPPSPEKKNNTNQKLKTKNQKAKAKGQKPEALDEKPKTKNQKPEKKWGTTTVWFLVFEPESKNTQKPKNQKQQ